MGTVIARQRNLPLVDLDEQIETEAGKSIREIFDEGGESMFRDLESEALQEVAAGPAAVVSLGGGAILRKENRDLIRETGVCLWLDADAEVLAARIQNDESTSARRPSLTAEGLIDEIATLLDLRRPQYQESAMARIDTSGKTIEQVAAEAIKFLTAQL